MKTLYIRIGKTGSTSLSTAFSKNVIEVTPSLKFEKIYSKHTYDFRFTFIRNPYDRIVSAYLMNTKSILAADYYIAFEKKDILNIPFNEYIKKVIYFRNIYQELGLKKKNNIHLRPWKNKKQKNKNRFGCEAYWILAHTEGIVDSIEYFTPLSTIYFIGRYESLNDDYNRLGEYIDLKEELG
ncbi:MAG: sulfotransferase family 2 domain-containing protein, partial [Gammaproteobacteria bacterium]